jgi:multidrug resistance efflux pump
MIKYVVVMGLFAVMTVSIAMIDARSSGLAENPTASSDRGLHSTDRIYASGIVEGRTEEIHLRPEQVGRVTEVLVAAGKCVEAGDVLVRLDDDRQRQEVALAKANLEFANAELERLKNGARAEEREEAHALHRAAKARLDQAVRTWNRIEQLSHQRAIPQQEAEDQQAQVDTLKAELEAAASRVRQIEAPARADEVRSATARVAAAQAQLDLAEIGIAKTELRAPAPGCVLDVNVEPGEFTGPDAAEPLVVLSDTSVVRVRAYVEELDAPRVEIGMPARVTADGIPNTTFTGRVVSISPCMVDKLVDADRPNELYDMKVREVLLELDGASQLIVGLRVDVSFDVVAGQSPAEPNQQITLSFIKNSFIE